MVRFRPQFTYANIIATIALILSLGGTAYAAIADGSILSRHIRNGGVTKADLASNSVNSLKVANGSLLAADFKAGSLPAGPQGPAGTPGANGTHGTNGLNGSPGAPGVDGADGVDATAPSGAVMFFNLATCPAGWSELVSARGRYLVGYKTGGTLGGTVGTELSAAESRATGSHTHAENGHNHGGIVTPAPFSVQSGAGAQVQAYNPMGGSTQFGGSTPQVPVGSPPGGTNAPYVQLLVCQKS